MIHRRLRIGEWIVDFLFAEMDYDIDGVISFLYDADAPEESIEQALNLMDSCRHNCGFTFSNPFTMRGVVLIGPVDSGPEFLNTIVHEIRHFADGIARYHGHRLDSEQPAYLSGDTAMAVADVICELGCGCNRIPK